MVLDNIRIGDKVDDEILLLQLKNDDDEFPSVNTSVKKRKRTLDFHSLETI